MKIIFLDPDFVNREFCMFYFRVQVVTFVMKSRKPMFDIAGKVASLTFDVINVMDNENFALTLKADVSILISQIGYKKKTRNGS